ncbi:hypothetical protein [Buttiauxella sp. A111]|uniref:hypothetical protein n=1 Tax=Buttiauxella sp. A111 TaxID=2563088 RepID=UPI0010EE3006|nr:hypothetical protein [Buttiauxella sp. A111]GDX06333.1 hypothetical protein BSPA111_25420 [Buttiauxella sp. A111]
MNAAARITLIALANDLTKEINSKTMADTLTEWNCTVQVLGLAAVYDFPTNYKRKNAIVADLQRVSAQLIAMGEVEAAHAEALEIDAAIDLIIDERQQVSDCGYDEYTESQRLKSIGSGVKEKFGEDFKALKETALGLWFGGFVTYPPEECGAVYVDACVSCRQQWAYFA